jgi:2-C-methyl-D-erythritol 4-phosphate cytidylyltransferase
VPLAGRPMVEWSIEAFRVAPSVRSIVVAVPPGLEQKPPWDEQKLGGGGVEVVKGGATRVESVSNGLEAVGTDLVTIHDAARPLVTLELIEETIATLIANPEASGAIAATPVTDTIKQVREEVETGEATAPLGRNVFSLHGRDKALRPIEVTLDRGRLWGAQTPQVFRVDALREALAAWAERAAADPKGIGEATDEAMLVEADGGKVLIYPSPPENLKVTTPLDLMLAELLLAER